MSLQWTLVAGVMYVELFVTIILLLPVLSAKRWHAFFKSRFLDGICRMAGFYFKIMVAVLLVCFLDALREMHKYGSEGKAHDHGDHAHLDVSMQQHMRLFRAQRNFYISGFALVLCVVIQRLTTLLSNLAVVEAGAAAAIKQAESASAAAQQLMQGDDQGSAASTKQLLAKEAEVVALQEEMDKLKIDYDAVLKQAEGVKREYDRLLEEHATLQGQGGDKKDD